MAIRLKHVSQLEVTQWCQGDTVSQSDFPVVESKNLRTKELLFLAWLTGPAGKIGFDQILVDFGHRLVISVLDGVLSQDPVSKYIVPATCKTGGGTPCRQASGIVRICFWQKQVQTTTQLQRCRDSS